MPCGELWHSPIQHARTCSMWRTHSDQNRSFLKFICSYFFVGVSWVFSVCCRWPYPPRSERQGNKIRKLSSSCGCDHSPLPQPVLSLCFLWLLTLLPASLPHHRLSSTDIKQFFWSAKWRDGNGDKVVMLKQRKLHRRGHRRKMMFVAFVVQGNISCVWKFALILTAQGF